MESSLAKAIGERIARQREKLGLSQAKLAEKSDISPRIISCSERGKNTLRADNIVKIASVLGVSTDYLLTGSTLYDDAKELLENINALSPNQRKSLVVVVQAFIEAVQ